MKLNKRHLIIALAGLILSGCSTVGEKYDQFISNQVETTAIQVEHTTEELLDIRLVPEFEQVQVALNQLDNVNLGREIYHLNQAMIHKQVAFDLSINQMAVYEAEATDATLGLGETSIDKPGGIILMHVSVTNKTNASFYLPIDELRLTYQDAATSYYATMGLYPMQTGNLMSILSHHNQGEISAGATVEGYLVYGITNQDLEAIKKEELFYLTVKPPVKDKDTIIGLGVNDLGNDLPLFLPLSSEKEALIQLNNTYIQDRISAEWWGNKILLDSQTVNSVQLKDGVKLTILRIETSDLEVNETYEESFQFFPNGQVIVSIEFEIENQTEQTLLPIDSIVTLTIDGSTLKSEYALINEIYGQELLPGEKAIVIKSFALDKMTYQQLWQAKEMRFNFQIEGFSTEQSDSSPSVISSETSNNQLEESDNETVGVGDLEIESVEEVIAEDSSATSEVANSIYIFELNYLPKLIRMIDDQLRVVNDLKEIQSQTEETTVEETQ